MGSIQQIQYYNNRLHKLLKLTIARNKKIKESLDAANKKILDLTARLQQQEPLTSTLNKSEISQASTTGSGNLFAEASTLRQQIVVLEKKMRDIEAEKQAAEAKQMAFEKEAEELRATVTEKNIQLTKEVEQFQQLRAELKSLKEGPNIAQPSGGNGELERLKRENKQLSEKLISYNLIFIFVTFLD